MLAFSFPSKFLADTEAFNPMKKPREQSKPTKHFQSNSLGFLIVLNASVCARNFEIFFVKHFKFDGVNFLRPRPL
jgi:phage regulator Rha-like protein